MIKRASDAETAAAADAEQDRGPPADVINVMEALVHAISVGRMGLAAFIPRGGTRVYYTITAVDMEGGRVPVAIIPHGIALDKFIRLHDEWQDQLGCAEADPDFKGVKM